MADPCLESNQWVTLSMSPLSQLQVNLNPSARTGNAFQLDSDGIFVPGYQKLTVAPLGAEDGDLWTWESPDQAVSWSFIYSDVYGDWLFQGGGELYDEVQTSGTRAGNASPAYGDLTAGGGGGTGPIVTIPFAGTYTISFGAMVNASLGDTPAFMSPSIGGATAVDADSLRSGTTFSVSLMRRETRAVLAAGATIQMKYKNTGGGGDPNATFSQRWLTVKPVSVSA